MTTFPQTIPAPLSIGTLIAVPEFPKSTAYFVGTVTASEYVYHHGHGVEVTVFTVQPADGGRPVRLTFEDLIGAVVLPVTLGQGLVEELANYGGVR